MTSIVMYAGKGLVESFGRLALQETKSICIEKLVHCAREYGVPKSCIDFAENAHSLREILIEKKGKTTLMLPGGYAPLMHRNFVLAKIDQLVRQKVQEGSLNCFGSCAGMIWMVDHVMEKEEKAFPPLFPKYRCVHAFQSCIEEKGVRVPHIKAPVVIPTFQENKPFQAVWNQGMCVHFTGDPIQDKDEMQASKLIASYTEEELLQEGAFQVTYEKLGYLKQDQGILKERYPYAGIMRITEKKSVLIGIGFHPEIPLDLQQYTLGISPEENGKRAQRFLFSIFDQLTLPKSSVKEVQTLAEKHLKVA
jgi:hypothetical protein